MSREKDFFDWGARETREVPGFDAETARMVLSHAPGLDREMPYEVPLTNET